jgi:hypothetical protein
MKSQGAMSILLGLFISTSSPAAFAGGGGFAACYAKAYQTMTNAESVTACAGAQVGFSDCYAKAYQTMTNAESVHACVDAGTDFLDCYVKAYQTMTNADSVHACAVRTCNQ